jgi:uncharacterized SAM-binding protein YcdF (DUF218 family)
MVLAGKLDQYLASTYPASAEAAGYHEFARLLTAAGVPGDVIRVEDQSADTWQNVELSLPCACSTRSARNRCTRATR